MEVYRKREKFLKEFSLIKSSVQIIHLKFSYGFPLLLFQNQFSHLFSSLLEQQSCIFGPKENNQN
jgi:hypothetical protein